MKSVAIFSIKGGVGKSTTAVNLAHAAATSGGRRTLLWDLDSQGAATYLLKLAPRSGAKARAAVAGETELSDLVLESEFPNLDVLPADKSLRRLEGDLAQTDKLKQLKKHLKSLSSDYDRVIVDCPPGLSELSDRLFRAVDLIVLPIIPSPLSDRAAEQLRAELQKSHGGRPPLLPLWSMADRRRKLHRETIDRHPDWPVIPYASAVEAMAVHQSPVAVNQPGSPAARAFAGLWSRAEMALLNG
ncbi:ParA family protein [Sandaracinobacter sp. RS1-74]|uniref:ParA family protein n=1 Tax=Sandaracinobacteroides sayramensis TaxID=2913411 RepID=UPI001EDB18EF|nr:ParA family protein [Sandaracinobacteroides sayramensis]